MTLVRGVAVAGGTVLLALWLVSVVSIGAPASRPMREPPESVEVNPPFQFDAQVARLKSRAGQRTAPPGRNPFTFGLDAADAADDRDASVPMRGNSAPGPTSRTAIEPLALIGIAQRKTDAGIERVAIVSGDGQLFLAGVGQRVGIEYIVEAIADDAVDLTGENGRRLHLQLR